MALTEGVDRRELCRRFKISAKTLYKWLARYRAEGPAVLADRSRRPQHSPRSEKAMEAAVLCRQGLSPPVPSTITAILHRHNAAMAAPGQKIWKRFEHAEPNVLWQMDFTGHVALGSQGRLHPLTVIDDHSRYSVALHAAGNEQRMTVQNAVRAAFERYGLPLIVLTDNGTPWGDRSEHRLTRFGVWLIEHGMAPWHSAPYHPQNHGKNERFNRTLNAELLEGRMFSDLGQAQVAFDTWRHHYNHRRPHDALDLAVPADRYRVSSRPYHDGVELFAYSPGDIVRRVDLHGRISFQNRRIKASKALIGKDVALRPTPQDGVFDLFFRHVSVRSIDLNR